MARGAADIADKAVGARVVLRLHHVVGILSGGADGRAGGHSIRKVFLIYSPQGNFEGAFVLMRVHFWRAASIAVACLAFAAAAEAAEKKQVEKKPPSECKGLDTAACSAKSQCSWYKEITMKNGKKRKAHCRKKPTRSTEAKKPA